MTTPSKPTIAREAREISAALRAMGDPVRAAGMQRYFKDTITAIGIKAPTLRAFVRERVTRLRGVWSAEEAIALCDRLLREPEFEIRGAGLLMLAAFRKELTAGFLPVAERWLETRIDNWAAVDGFCGEVLSHVVERLPELEALLPAWSRHERLWVRRASMVTLLRSAHYGRRLDLVYRLAGEHLGDPEDLMHKATGWVLREAGRTDRPRLKQFLLTHGPAVPRTALRYAIEHFPPAERISILQQTRPVRTRRARA